MVISAQERLLYQPPWNWQQFHDHYALRALPGVEHLAERAYSRSVQLNGVSGWFQVEALSDQPAIQLTVSSSLHESWSELIPRVRRMFDLDCQPTVIAQHLSRDPLLRQLVARHPGLRLPTAWDPFEQAVRAIVGQQVTVKAAVTITNRLIARLGHDLIATEAPHLLRLFPSAEAIADADLTGIGMPTRRVHCLQHFATQVASGVLTLDVRQGHTAFVEKLCSLPGIGPWTAEYIALRAFGEADAFPASDLGLLKAPIWGASGISAKQLQARAEDWRPWRAYAAAYLWQDYSAN
jgi:DNA-3-methyladenine glycosylase II